MTPTTCTCHPGTTCTSAASCATARELHFGAQPAAVSDAEVDRAAQIIANDRGYGWPHIPESWKDEFRETARAILAQRPQAESEQEKELRRSLAEAQATISERNAEIVELQRRIRSRPQAVPMTDEQIEALLVTWPKDGIAFFDFARAVEAHHGITAQAKEVG